MSTKGDPAFLLVTSLILAVATVHLGLITTVFQIGFNPAVIDAHAAVSGFIRKRQLAIEVFPPLSLVSGSTLAPAFVTAIAKICDVFVPCAVVGHGLGFKMPKILAITTFFFLLWKMYADHISNSEQVLRSALETSASIANAWMTLAMLFVLESDSIPAFVKKIDSVIGIAEFAVLQGAAHGSNAFDAILAYGVVFGARLIRFMEALPAEKGNSIWLLAIRGMFTVGRFLILPIVTYVSIYAAYFPSGDLNGKSAEVGGNYNMQFLSPSYRRAISPNRTTTYPLNHTLDPFAGLYVINSSIPVTIYFPQSGFLSVSASDVRVITHYENEDGSDAESEPVEEIQQRYAIQYTDVKPQQQAWQFEYKVVYEEATGNLVDEPQDSQSLRTNEVLWLKNNQFNKFLSVNSDDEGDTSGDIKRYSLSLTNKPTMENSGWMVTYDPHSDSGIRLYNPNSACYLASTLRSKPLSPEESAKLSLGKVDVVKQYLDLAVEAVCNTSPTDATSRLSVTDGLPSLLVWPPTTLYKALEIPTATLRLLALRKNYGNFQGSVLPGVVPPSDSFLSVHNLKTKLPNLGLAALLSLLYFSKLVWLQRFGKEGACKEVREERLDKKEKGALLGVSDLERPAHWTGRFEMFHLGVALVLAHNVVYEGLGKEVRYTPIFVVATGYLCLVEWVKTL